MAWRAHAQTPTATHRQTGTDSELTPSDYTQYSKNPLKWLEAEQYPGPTAIQWPKMGPEPTKTPINNIRCLEPVSVGCPGMGWLAAPAWIGVEKSGTLAAK